MTATMTTFENGTAQFDVSELWVDTVGVTSVSADWDALGGEYHEGFESYEVPDCPECGDYAVWDSDDREWTCSNGHEREIIEDPESSASGPMMNYYYPLPDLRRVGDDPNEAAWRIRDLPLCVVQFSDGSYALALTGGGMDLSWEICEAFTRLGYLPPLAFSHLPDMAGYPRDDDQRYVIRACMRSAEVAAHQAQRTRDHLAERYSNQ